MNGVLPAPMRDKPIGAGWAVAAACTLGAAGYGFYQSLPVVLGSLAKHRGFNDQQVGWLGSAELSGMLFGGLFAAWVVAHGRHRKLAMSGLSIVLMALVFTAVAVDLRTTGVVRLFGGFGAGLTYSICVACLASTDSPTRNFGILNAVMVVFGATQLAAFPWIDSFLGLNGVLAILALECAVAAVLLPAVPVPRPAAQRSEGTHVPTVSAPALQVRLRGWGYIVATALFHVAPAAFWTYCERLGSERGLSAEFVGATLTVISLLVAGGCVLAWRISNRWGEHRALLVAGVLMGLSLLSWAAPASGTLGYVLRAVLFFLTWGIAGVFQQSESRLLDSTGRMTTLVPVAQNAGLAIGPFAGATILGWGLTLPDTLALSAVFVLASLALYVWVGAATPRRGSGSWPVNGLT